MDPIAVIEDCRQSRAERKCEDARAVGGRESIGHNVKCVGLDLERREGGSDVLRSPDFPRVDLKADALSRAQAPIGLIGGQVQVYFGVMASSIEHIRAGTVRALAVTTATRSAALPDVPTVGESVAGYEASAWWGIGAPRNTPVEIIKKLNNEINAALADPKIKARIADLGGTTLGGSPADFGKLIANDVEKWGQVIRAANIKPD